ncbi:MAG: FtsQ-type POTRA domain-containing protein [Betaproteobacteria bacterium]|nr:FtsQ-type POTRA domain-containing protein [Betaproteobacteria bacterium]
MWDRPDILNRVTDLLLALALGLVVYGAMHVVVRQPVFSLREVRVTGMLAHVNGEELAAVISRELKGNFFTVDLAAIRAALERIGWVKTARLRRQWPDRLDILLEEQVPIARWGGSALVNQQGEIFEAPFAGELPMFVGPRESAKEIAIQYEYFRRILATIGAMPEQVQVSPRRAWQIRLAGGPTIELGREQIEARLSRFVASYPRTLGRLGRRIDYVDLRYANGFAVRVPELQSQRTEPRKRRTVQGQGRT